MKSKKYNIYQRNPKKTYEGSHYAITGKGGFSIKESYAMKLAPIRHLGKYDMTNAVQILFPAAVLNGLLGGYNQMTKQFKNNRIVIVAKQFLNTVKKDDILAVGEFDSMYFDYQRHVNNYFGNTDNNSSLFTCESQKDINNTIFDKNGLYSILHEKSICSFSGEIKDAFDGYIEMNDVSEMLHKICELDLFGNNLFGNRISHDICKGFIDGDLIYIPEGIHIKLNMDMSTDSSVVSVLENSFHTNSRECNIELPKLYTSALLLRLV